MLALLVVSGCFHVSHRPTCEEIAVTEVADDDVTSVGTVDAFLAQLAFDDQVDATWEDGTPTTADLRVARGTGTATWVERIQGTATNRSFGFGRSTSMAYVACQDTLRVPIEVDIATPDGELAFYNDGHAEKSDLPPPLFLNLEGTFEEAVFPPGEDDPEQFTDKYSFVNLNYDGDRFAGGTAGWGGDQEDDDASSTYAIYVLDFAP